MTKDEWIKWHNERSPHDPYEPNIYHSEMFDEKNGILRFYYDEPNAVFYITEIIGNLKYWYPIAEFVAKAYGAKQFVGFSHISNPKALQRLFKTDKYEQIQDGDRIMYKFYKEVR